LWISQERFDWLATNILDGPAEHLFQGFHEGYENSFLTCDSGLINISGADSLDWVFDFQGVTEDSDYWRALRWTPVYTALLARITDEDVMEPRLRFMADAYIAGVDTLALSELSHYEAEDLLLGYSQAGGILLDWGHYALPPATREALARSLYEINTFFVWHYIQTEAGNSYVSSHNTQNSMVTLQNVIALSGAEGLTSAEADSVEQWYQLLHDKWVDQFFPVYEHYREDAGGWNWGAAYANSGMMHLYSLFDNMLFGTDVNWYQDHPWMETTINQFWHMHRPGYDCIHLGDRETHIETFLPIFRHAVVYNDERSKWLTQVFTEPPYDNFTWTGKKFWQLITQDLEMADLPDAPPVPLDWLSKNVGLMTSRTSWEEDATLLWFFNSKSKRASHEHRDNNSFVIYHHQPQIIDSGYYDSYESSHFKNYYTRTVAHNSVCVHVPGEDYFYCDELVANDGGQIYSPQMKFYDDIFDPANQRGRWLSYSSGEGYCYGAADAALSYDSGKVERFHRRILFLKPDRVIVLDHVDLASNPGAFRQVQWLAHFPGQPVFYTEPTEVTVPGHIEVFEGGDYYASHGGGNVAIRTLLPAAARVSRIGGVGAHSQSYEYYVDGLNYPPSRPPGSANTPGAWRIEVSPATQSDTNVLLHTIAIGDDTNPAQAVGSLLFSNYSLAVDGDSTLAVFSAAGDTSCLYQQVEDVCGDRDLLLWVADLCPNEPYKVLVDSTATLYLRSGPGGVALGELSLSSGPSHKIEIVHDPPVSVQEFQPGSSQAKILLSAYPNPFNPNVGILFTLSGRQNVRIAIYDLTGRRVAKVADSGFGHGAHTVIWDGKNADGGDVSSGAYLVRIYASGQSESRKVMLVR